MKAPEEVKKGLECCILETDDTSLVDHCRACPYQPTGLCFRTLLKDALAYIQRLEAQAPKWISVEERLPDKQGDCLVLYSFGETNADCFAGVMYFIRYDERPHFENDGLYGLHVTHWMPLPSIPEEEK